MAKKIGRNDPCPCGSGKKYKKCHGNEAANPFSIEPALEDMYMDLQKIEEQAFGELSSSLGELVTDLASYARLSALTALAALSLVAENRTHIVRLDALVHFAAIYSSGAKQVSVDALNRWLNQFLHNSSLSRREDPAEDVAVGNVMTKLGNRRVFTGDWSNPDYYLQDVLDALETGPGKLELLRAECDSVLRISELLAERRGYPRLTGKPESESSTVWLPASDQELRSLSRQSLIDFSEFTTLHITPELIEPFSSSLDEFCSLAPKMTLKAIRRKPFVLIGDVLLVVYPTTIPMAIVSHVFSSVRRLGLLGCLQRSLGRTQGRRTLREATDGVQRPDSLIHLLPPEGRPLTPYVSQTAFRFDGDKYLHLLFLHDDVHEIESEGIHGQWRPPFSDFFPRLLIKSAQKFLDHGSCVGGLTLIVVGGVWRGCQLAIPQRLSQNCEVQVWSSADLDRLMMNERRWKLLLWKLSTQRSALEELGTAIEAHSDANLYAVWMNRNYRFIPSDASLEPLNYLAFGPEFIFDMRKEYRDGLDDHCAYRPDRANWERVRRLNSKSHFQEDVGRKTYGALSPVARGILEGAVETSKRTWWIDCSTNPSSPDCRHFVYMIWDTAVNWIDRIASNLDDLIPELGTGNLVLSLDLSEIAEHADWTAEVIKKIPFVDSIPIEIRGRVASLRVPIAFLAMGYSATNDAERLLVNTFVKAVLALAGLQGHEQRAKKVADSLALSDDDRFMHFFATKQARHYLQGLDFEVAELLHDDELAFGSIGIAQESKLEAPSKIDNVESCNRALNQFVDSFWRRIESRLRQIDRVSLIVACLRNHERLLSDLDRWQKTSRAVLSLHQDRSDVLKATQALKMKRDRTQITHRIMIEMAVCISSLTGGRSVTQSDLDYLGTQILLLIRTAAQSDAVRGGCANPGLQISSLGDFRFDDNFMDVMIPYVTSHFEKSHMKDVERYSDMLSDPIEGSKTEEEVFGGEFVGTFHDEFGISPGRLAELGMVLLEGVIEKRASVVVKEVSSLVEELKVTNFFQREIDGILRSFVLRPRDRWDTVQHPFRNRDWYPWRYRRRLSLMTRPIVDLGNGTVAYAPGFCEDSFRHTVMECFNGAFDTGYFDSKKMKKYIGAINAHRGLEFNKAVGNLFSANGWHVRTEVGITEFGAQTNEASGDIDVLAWKDNLVCICECKELLFARNISEVTDQLMRFRGAAGDELDKHLKRVRYIQSHTQELFRITSIVSPRIVPLLVTSKVVPMQFTEIAGTKVVSADEVTSTFLANLDS